MATAERRIEENKDLARRDVEEVWNGGNLDLVDEYVAEEFVLHDPAAPGDLRGPDGYKQIVAMYRTAFPDTHVTIEEMVAEDDAVVVRWTGRGTHEGEFMGIEPTNEAVEVPGMTLVHVEDGTITESWQCYDALDILGQIDALPEDFAW